MAPHDEIAPFLTAALAEADWAEAFGAALARAGCDADTALVAASVCRDELCRPLIWKVEERWGPVFDLSGLAGIPPGGDTALAAALGHLPSVTDDPTLVLVGMAHIGVDGDGRPGRVVRPSMTTATPTCGSLAAVGAARGPLDDGVETDPEQARVRRQVVAHLGRSPNPGPVALTVAALAAIEAELDRLAATLLPHPSGPAVGLFTGIQIHRYEGSLIWPSRSELHRDGHLHTGLVTPA